MAIEPFHLPFSQEAVDDLRARLARTRWLDEIPGAAWDYGFPQAFLQEICAYWRDAFDWQAQLQRMAAFDHFRCEMDGFRVHFIHARSNRQGALPLLITHGWPGSFLEMLELIPLLADEFHVVVPSLPGFGFSDHPRERGANTFWIAERFARMMTELGYERFGVQGGDLGANVSTVLALRHPERVAGVHLNYIPGSYRPYVAPGEALSDAERSFQQDAARWYEESGAYAHIQRTHPQTAAYGLNDSPAALAAWIVEKFRDWSDCDGNAYRRFTRDELLANVTLYWMTETIHSSFRLYYESRLAPLQLKAGERVAAPTAIARFPKEAPFPPREWIERGYNVVRWTEMASGGHFAAAEEPELLARDAREFFGALTPN